MVLCNWDELSFGPSHRGLFVGQLRIFRARLCNTNCNGRVISDFAGKDCHMRLNILITGGAGYIGSHTCKALAEAGYNPIALDDLIRALVRKTVKRFGIRATVHFAAHAYVGESVKQRRKYFDNNVSKTLALLE